MTGQVVYNKQRGKNTFGWRKKKVVCPSQKYSAEVYREEGFGYANELVILSQMNWAFKDNFLLFCGMGYRRYKVLERT